MPRVVLAGPLRRMAGGVAELGVDGTTAGEVLRGLERLHPALSRWILDERGRLREHVRLFVGEVDADLDTVVGEEEEIYIVQAISGGACEPGSPGEAAPPMRPPGISGQRRHRIPDDGGRERR